MLPIAPRGKDNGFDWGVAWKTMTPNSLREHCGTAQIRLPWRAQRHLNALRQASEKKKSTQPANGRSRCADQRCYRIERDSHKCPDSFCRVAPTARAYTVITTSTL